MRDRTVAGLLACVLLVWALPVRADDGYQRFIIECTRSHAAPDDPIVHPRQPGASHTHDFFGNSRTDARPGYRRMLRGGTTCAHADDLSAVWVPAIRDRETGEVVHADEVRVYYYSTAAMDDDRVVAFPRGFATVSDRGSWMCRNTERLADPPDCSGRLTSAAGVGIVVVFDEVCWDGVAVGPDADAAWAPHVSPMSSGDCPAGRQLPWLSVQARYPVVDASGFEVVSAPGRGPHADFWNTWRQRSLRTLVRSCLQPGQADCGTVST